MKTMFTALPVSGENHDNRGSAHAHILATREYITTRVFVVLVS